jgi:hypothetical protein
MITIQNWASQELGLQEYPSLLAILDIIYSNILNLFT